MDHINIGRRLVKLPNIRVVFDAQADMHRTDVSYIDPGDWRDGTRFESVALDSPDAEVFTHYLAFDGDLSSEDEHDVSYYNACSYDEDTPTLHEQQQLVAQRFDGL